MNGEMIFTMDSHTSLNNMEITGDKSHTLISLSPQNKSALKQQIEGLERLSVLEWLGAQKAINVKSIIRT